MRLDPSVSARNIILTVKKGTPAATPEPPELTRVSDGVYELSLAQIAVNAGASELQISREPDGDVCGYVALLTMIDAGNLFAQFSSAFYSWFDAVKSEIASATLIVPLRYVHSR